MRNVSNYPRHRLALAAALSAIACVPVSAATWKPVNTGLPSTSTGVLTITIDPITPSTLYAITTTKTIFKSADDGASWNAVSGLTGVNALAIDPKDSSTMYAATTHGIFKTGDRGGNWAGVYAGLTTTYILTVVIDPGTPSTIYAIAGNSEILKSTDEAASWNPITTGPWTPRTPQPISITVDPVNSSTTYVVAWEAVSLRAQTEVETGPPSRRARRKPASLTLS